MSVELSGADWALLLNGLRVLRQSDGYRGVSDIVVNQMDELDKKLSWIVLNLAWSFENANPGDTIFDAASKMKTRVTQIGV